MGAARKPVIVRKLTREWCAGYAAANPVGPDAENQSSELELLLSAEKLLRISWDQVKWVCYVRELAVSEISASDTVNPERLLRRRFSSRPRVAGVWLRLTLTDGDELEGVAANDLSLVNGTGLLLTPPDTRSNTQRVFVPRSSIRDLTILAVINPATSRGDKASLQPDLFARDSASSNGDDDQIGNQSGDQTSERSGDRSILPFRYNR